MSDDRSWERWRHVREARARLDALRLNRQRAAGDVPLSMAHVERWRAEAFESREGKLLPFTGTAPWLREQSAKDDEDGIQVRVAVRRIDVGFGSMTMPWQGVVRPETPAAGLPDVAKRVRDEQGWTLESAAGWVLTGCPPEVEGAVVETIPRDPTPDQQWRVVTLRIPIEMSPNAVAELYREERETMLSQIVPLRGNPIGRKALEATLFAVEMNVASDPENLATAPSWQEAWEQWERRVSHLMGHAPDAADAWRFKAPKAFAFTCRETYRRLTGSDLEWVRPPGTRKR